MWQSLRRDSLKQEAGYSAVELPGRLLWQFIFLGGQL